MKFILCQPAIQRFQWELEVCINNLKSLGYDKKPFGIVLLFAEDNVAVVNYFRKTYPEVEVYSFPDNRDFKSYQPSIKPYLWWKYLEENPDATKGDYCYIDSDVIFRERLDLSVLQTSPTKWFGSDCNGYLNYDYMVQCTNGRDVLIEMCKIVGVSEQEVYNKYNRNSGGAQWIITDPSMEYWKKVYEDSNKLHLYLNTVDTNLQKWTAEMWAQLWNMSYFGIDCEVSPELDFSWATDPIQVWYDKKIYHNAGVTPDRTDLFFKGRYTGGRDPFYENHDYVNPDYCSFKYVEALKEVKMITNG